MPQTHAERQTAYRQRQAGQIAALRAELADARSALADAQAVITAQAAEIARLEHESERVYALLEEAPAASRDAGPRTPDCPHPAALVEGDRCGGCGQVVDVW